MKRQIQMLSDLLKAIQLPGKRKNKTQVQMVRFINVCVIQTSFSGEKVILFFYVLKSYVYFSNKCFSIEEFCSKMG